MTADALLGKLYDAADDDESSSTIDALLERAGLTWTCRNGHLPWTVAAWDGEGSCRECGAKEPQKP